MTGISDILTTCNVSRTKLLSPFRYPGGKTRLVPLVRRWLTSLDPTPANFIEPFAGGAIVGLTVAFEKLANNVTLVEIDERIGAVWHLILERGRGEWLARRIEDFELTAENVETLLGQKRLGPWQQAFQTIVHNRVSRGGIIAEGAGLLKDGENSRGLASRWYPTTLARRIRDIHKHRNEITFVLGDGLQVVEQNRDRVDTVFFVDPPYTAGHGKRAGQRLYEHSELDHERLFSLMNEVRGEFLMTYDDGGDVRAMAARYGFSVQRIAMRNAHHRQQTELLISRNFRWIDQ